MRLAQTCFPTPSPYPSPRFAARDEHKCKSAKDWLQRTQLQQPQYYGSKNSPNRWNQTDYPRTPYRTQPPYRRLCHAEPTPSRPTPRRSRHALSKLMFPHFTPELSNYFCAARQIATNSSATNEAPPIRPPSISAIPNNASAFAAFTLPP